MTTPTFPMDFIAIRKTLVNFVQGATGVTCIVEKRKGQSAMSTPRPPLPYLSIEITAPAAKIGTDGFQPTGTEENPSSVVNFGGVRRMTVTFRSYAREQEEAYNYLALLEALFDTDPTQELFRAGGFAFWQSLGVDDSSALLTAGYEGRASLDVYFGVPSSINLDLGEMDSVPVNGEIAWGSESADVNFTVTGDS